MADINQQTQEIAEALAQLNKAMGLQSRAFSTAAQQTLDDSVKAKTGIKNFTAGTDAAADAITSVAKAGMSAAGAMLEGKKGAAAFNGAIDEMSNAAKMAGAALALLVPGGPIIKLFIAGITAAVTATADYVKKSNDMADKLYSGYSKLAKSGAAASSGITGMFEGTKKLGLSMDQLDGYVGLVAENSKDLALFAGSVFEGRKRFEDMGAAMEPYRKGLIAAGYTQEEINEGAMGYLKLQTRMGAAQRMTTDQLAEGARKYLLEQDALAKVTGQSRKEMETGLERAMQQQQFAAKIRELEKAGKDKEAKELMKLNSMYSAMGPKMASAFQASVTGNLANADAVDANIASNMEMIRTADAVSKGNMTAAEAAQTTGKAIGKFNDDINIGLGSVNAAIGDFAEFEKARQMTEGDIVENMKKAEAERKKQGMEGGKAADALTEQYAINAKKMQEVNERMEKDVFKGIGNALEISNKLIGVTEELATVFTKLTTAANEFLSILGLGKKPTKEETTATKTQDEKNWESASAVEKAQSSVARGLERFGRGLGRVTGIGIFERLADTAQANRVEAESEYLKKEGKFQAAPPPPAAPAPEIKGTGATPPAAPAPEIKGTGAPPPAKPVLTGEGELQGLTIKKGDVQAPGAQVNPKIIEMAKQIQANMPDFAYFSGFNDRYHQENAPSSSHTKGNAMDFVLSKTPNKEEGQEIVKWLKSLGASVAIDEYNNPSRQSTAPHIHAQVAGYADGGIAETPQIAMVAEKGPEAMIPLVNGSIPIKMDFPEDLKKFFQLQSQADNLRFLKGNEKQTFADISPELEQGQAKMFASIDTMKQGLIDQDFTKEWLESYGEGLKSKKTEENIIDLQTKYSDDDQVVTAVKENAAATNQLVLLISDLLRAQKEQNSISGRLLQVAAN